MLVWHMRRAACGGRVAEADLAVRPEAGARGFAGGGEIPMRPVTILASRDG